MQTRKTTYDQVPEGQDSFLVPILNSEITRILKEHPATTVGGRALDAGCGRQPFRNLIESLGYKYFGLDVEQTPENSVDFISSFGEPISAGTTGTFDLILCTEVLEHVADWNNAFSNFRNLVNTDGYVVLTCPHLFPLHEEPFDFWRPTMHAVRYYAQKVGLELVEERTAGDAWDALGTVIGSCHPWPVSTKLSDRIIAKLAKWMHQFVFRVLRNPEMRKRFEIRGKLYLTNIAVLRKAR